MSKVPLDTAGSAVFTGLLPDTRAVLVIGPDRANVGWTVKRIVTTTNSTEQNSSLLRVYRNTETPSQLQDSTFLGDSDSSETDIAIRSGERMVFVWTGGTPGSTATIILSGDIDVF